MNIKCIYLRDKLKNYIKKSQKNSYDNVSKRLITPPAIGQLSPFPPIGGSTILVASVKHALISGSVCSNSSERDYFTIAYNIIYNMNTIHI